MRKLKRVVIKEELVALTGDIIEAIILNQFLYWSERVEDFDRFIIEEKERAQANGINLNFPLTNGWIYKKISELKDETMLTDSEKTIRRKVQNLVEKGFLQERQNPMYKWDKTLQYRVNLTYIAKKLHEIGYTLDGYKYDISELVSEEDNCEDLEIESSIYLEEQNDISEEQTNVLEEQEPAATEIQNDASESQNFVSSEGQNDPSEGQEFVPSKGQNDASGGQDFVLSDGQNDASEGQFDASEGHNVPSKGQFDGAIPIDYYRDYYRDYNNSNNPPNGGVITAAAEINKKYKKITGRDKHSFFVTLLKKYPAERITNAVAYLEKATLQEEISNPEGFVVSTLKNNWDIQPFRYKTQKEFIPPRNYFNGYTQRTYNVKELEKKLLEYSYRKGKEESNLPGVTDKGIEELERKLLGRI
ncbi:hypothetical protein [Thermoanaerobacter thermohydrosulfuricus]|uniref:hypothetical protein n=1 Tax=Thermoanaerobacter thermohydrosulfuricus TaxID=1516 RepID=UPI000945387A|nr:hypothetical protein [Thermoanaerobacter thermohydrosulfuricus]